VLNTVEQQGALGAGSLSTRAERAGPWWDWSDEKHALEWLFAAGLVQAQPGAEREGTSGGMLQRRAGRQQQGLATELQGPPDHTVDAAAGGIQRGVGVGGGVPWRCAAGPSK